MCINARAMVSRTVAYCWCGVSYAKIIREVQEGGSISHAADHYQGAIPSYGGDTILHIPEEAASQFGVDDEWATKTDSA